MKKFVVRLLDVLKVIGVFTLSILACAALAWLATILIAEFTFLITHVRFAQDFFDFVHITIAVCMLLVYWIPLLLARICRKQK